MTPWSEIAVMHENDPDDANLLLIELKQLRSRISDIVSKRLKEFESIRHSSDDVIFKELCYCLLTANFTAERALHIQQEIDDGFLTFDEEELARTLKRLGYRFPNTRSRFIVEARVKRDEIINAIRSIKDARTLREWLAKNVKGFGMKEASHFLRNIGYHDVAIIDFHVIDVLVKYGLIQRPKTLTKKKYVEIENLLEEIADMLEISLGELDLYLWYMETGKILK